MDTKQKQQIEQQAASAALKKNEKRFFFKKKWPDVRPDENLTSGVRRQLHPT
jgi:hypothetical protein